jgi:hypothetical protein
VRFCRRCGGSLVTPSETPPKTTRLSVSADSDSPYIALRRELLWIAIRGFVTLLVAVPFFCLFLLSFAVSGSIIMGLASLVVLAFAVLGIRDLVQCYLRFRKPEKDIARLRANSEAEGTTDDVRLVSTPASVTEHTTASLDEVPNEQGL